MDAKVIGFTMHERLSEILSDNNVEIDSLGKLSGVYIIYADITTQMSSYEFTVDYNGTEREFVVSFIHELGEFDAAANAVDEIENGCVAETDDIRWYADAADELAEAVTDLRNELIEYAHGMNWSIV